MPFHWRPNSIPNTDRHTLYKVPLREVPKGVAHERKSKHPTSDCLWANKIYLVVVKTMLLTCPQLEKRSVGRRPSGYGSLSRRRRGGGPKISGNPISTYVSSASTRTMGTFYTGDSYAVKFAW